MAVRSSATTHQSLSDRLAAALTRAERGVTGRLAAMLALEGVSIEEWRALALLSDGEGHPMAELAEYVFMTSPTVTRLIDRMVADNLVHRKVDAHDRRRVLVFATARGRRLQRKLDRILHAGDDEIVADVDDAARLLELLDALEGQAARGRLRAP
jgi:DNA-binding MarR family transcriptional regulator